MRASDSSVGGAAGQLHRIRGRTRERGGIGAIGSAHLPSLRHEALCLRRSGVLARLYPVGLLAVNQQRPVSRVQHLSRQAAGSPWDMELVFFGPSSSSTGSARRILREFHLSRMTASASRAAAFGEARSSVAISNAVPKALKKRPI